MPCSNLLLTFSYLDRFLPLHSSPLGSLPAESHLRFLGKLAVDPALICGRSVSHAAAIAGYKVMMMNVMVFLMSLTSNVDALHQPGGSSSVSSYLKPAVRRHQ